MVNKNTFLRRLRIEKGLRLQDVADAAGVLKGTYYLIETGQRPAKPEVAQKIAGELGIAPEVIFMPVKFAVREEGYSSKVCS